MNINTQMRYGAYSEYSFRTTKTGKGDTGFEESMKPDNNIQYKSLGIGFLNVGDTGYGMRATQIINPDSEDTIVRVSIALGGNEFRDYDVNLSEIDPSNASAVEMFAYCQYADSTSEGSYKWGSWNALKHLSDDMAYSYNSLDEALTEKKNWNAALAGSGIELENEATGKRYFVGDLIEMLKQQYELTADDLEEKDWRDMSDKEWEKLLNSFDQNIDASKTEGATESASCDDESGEKVWTVTAYTEQGITCKEFKDGVGTLLWQIDFKNPTDYNKVMDYLDNEKEEDILKYARDKEFWEKLIWG